MKLRHLLILAIFILSNRAFTQNVEEVYCFWGDTLVIQETVRDTINNTIYVLYHESLNSTSFTIASRNDTTFSILNGNEYFLGTINSTVGEIWHPLWYEYASVTDTSNFCSTRTLEVTETGIMNYGGVNLKYVRLLEEINDPWNNSYYYTYVEQIGITHGGPLYSYSHMLCPQVTDIEGAEFMSYSDDIFSYSEPVECDHIGLDENESFQLEVIVNPDYLEVKSDQRIILMQLISTSGKIIYSEKNEHMEMNQSLSQGMYILNIMDEKQRRVSRKIIISD